MWVHNRFPLGFKTTVMTMMAAGRRDECFLSHCSEEIIFYIMVGLHQCSLQSIFRVRCAGTLCAVFW